MGGILRTIIWGKNGSEMCSNDFFTPDISLGNVLDFGAGSSILRDIIQNQWNCGSCAVTNGNMAIGVFLRKDENEQLLKTDIQNLKMRPDGKWSAPRYPTMLYSGLHHQDLTQVDRVEVKCIESGTITFVWEKKI